MKIAVVTHYDEAFASVGDITSTNNREYCERHGYDFLCFRERPDISKGTHWSIVWDKILICREIILSEKYDWIVYVDSDAIITNHNIKIESIIEQANINNEDFLIIANDVNGLNSGIFLLNAKAPKHNASFWFEGEDVSIEETDYDNWTTLQFLERCWEKRHNIPNKTEAEQTAMKQVLSKCNYVDTKLISPRLINSYLYPRYGYPATTEGNWEKGDFILHLPGVHNHDRVAIFNEYKQYIIK